MELFVQQRHLRKGGDARTAPPEPRSRPAQPVPWSVSGGRASPFTQAAPLISGAGRPVRDLAMSAALDPRLVAGQTLARRRSMIWAMQLRLERGLLNVFFTRARAASGSSRNSRPTELVRTSSNMMTARSGIGILLQHLPRPRRRVPRRAIERPPADLSGPPARSGIPRAAPLAERLGARSPRLPVGFQNPLFAGQQIVSRGESVPLGDPSRDIGELTVPRARLRSG